MATVLSVDVRSLVAMYIYVNPTTRVLHSSPYTIGGDNDEMGNRVKSLVEATRRAQPVFDVPTAAGVVTVTVAEAGYMLAADERVHLEALVTEPGAIAAMEAFVEEH